LGTVLASSFSHRRIFTGTGTILGLRKYNKNKEKELFLAQREKLEKWILIEEDELYYTLAKKEKDSKTSWNYDKIIFEYEKKHLGAYRNGKIFYVPKNEEVVFNRGRRE
jgi:hypothetical protein